MTVVWSLRSRSITLPDLRFVISYRPGPSKPPCAHSEHPSIAQANPVTSLSMYCTIANRMLRILFAFILLTQLLGAAPHTVTAADTVAVKTIGEVAPSPDGKTILFSVAAVDLPEN